MLFNSFEYCVFFLSVVFLYYALPARFRWILLLFSSYYFYSFWKPEYLYLLIIQTLVAYVVGIILSQLSSNTRRLACLLIGLIINFGILFYYKYFNFFSETTNDLFLTLPFLENEILSSHDLILPIGISFFTFQTTSYMIDVYRKKFPVEKHLGIFSLFVAFFPQLISGPIERGSTLIPQIKKARHFNHSMMVGGFRLILLGLFKKLVIADRLAPYVDFVYANPQNYEGGVLVLATVFFAFQIYCDFSGYIDIAIGSAQILGINLSDNFRRPYHARSVSDFWKRWNITLMEWLRDYIYIPLGGSRKKISQASFNLLVVFFLSGLWHGANWTFVIWGVINGIYLLAERLLKHFLLLIAPYKNRLIQVGLKDIDLAHNIFFVRTVSITSNILQKLYPVFCIFLTFSMICFSWIFFRANSLDDAFYISTHFYTSFGKFIVPSLEAQGWNVDKYIFIFACICLLEVFHLVEKYDNIRTMFSDKPIWTRWGVTYILLFSILFFGEFGNKPFIYFQF